MWKCAIAWLLAVLIQLAASLSASKTVVYPELLESRSTSEEKTLKISDDLVLNLVPKPAYQEEFTVTVFSDDGTEVNYHEMGSYYNKELFVDHSQQASVKLSQDGGLQVHGIIGEAIRISPIPVKERSSTGQVAHLLVHEELKQPTRHPSHAILSPLATDFAHTLTRREQLGERADKDNKIRPEIHLVIDSALFGQFRNNTKRIFHYFGAVLNAVNLRLGTISTLDVQARITGFTLNTNPLNETYITFQSSDDAVFVNDMETLEHLNNHYKKHRSEIYEKADVIFLITGTDLGFIDDDTLYEGVQGIAFLGGACAEKKVGLCEDKAGSFHVVRTLAHELGHSLGCTHDESDPDKDIPNQPSAQSCKWESGFLMSYSKKGLNQYKYSECCSRQMLHVSSMERYKCLKEYGETATTVSRPNLLPGSKTSLDEQCRLAVSDEFIYDTYEVLNRCVLRCVRPASGERRPLYWNIDSLDGTPCNQSDKTMVCIRGECRSHPEYPYDDDVIPPFRSTTTPATRPTTPSTMAPTTPTTTTTTKKTFYQKAKNWFKGLFRKGDKGKPLTPQQRKFALNPWFWWKKYKERKSNRTAVDG